MKEKIIVIGGGASGMTAAIVAAQKGNGQAEVCLLEKNDKLGKKLLATGNGRCNFTNIDCRYDDFLEQKEKNQRPESQRRGYAGGQDGKKSETDFYQFQKKALQLFPPQKTLRFFAGLGVMARVEDEGRAYPYSGQGSVIRDGLLREIERLGIQVHCGCTVKNMEKIDPGFDVEVEKILDLPPGKKVKGQGTTVVRERMTADKVILAAGGKAGPQFGTMGEGYKLAAHLGHQVNKPVPALVPICCDVPGLSQTKGVRAKGKVTLSLDGQPIAWDEGEIQFTGDGLSGICVFNLSRYVQWQNGTFPKGYQVTIDFSPELNGEEVLSLLEIGKSLLTHVSVVEFLAGVVHEKLAVVLLKQLSMDPKQKMGTFSENQLRRIGAVLKAWGLPVSGTKSWKDAQVTCGGVALGEIDEETMESKLINNFYITGELLDIDGRCGGFNLQWAWCTGYIAGSAAVKQKENYA